MRHLNRKQKNTLRRYISSTYFKEPQMRDKPYFFDCGNDLDEEFYWELSNMNSFECFDSCVDRFVDDIKTIKDCKVV